MTPFAHLILFVALIALVVAIILAFARPRARKRRKYERIVALDNPEERKAYLHETRDVRKLDSDELFTRATILLHYQDDLQDKLFARMETRAHRKEIARQLQATSSLARATIHAAIEKRNEENARGGDRARIFGDDTLDRRAQEIAAPIVPPKVAVEYHIVDNTPTRVPVVAAPVVAAPVVAAPVVAAPVVAWAPDPENVHDSALGDQVSRRITYLRAHDLHLFDDIACIDEINHIVAARDHAEKEQIERTLRRAQANDYCMRYKISELEALRLVMERAFYTQEDRVKDNLHDSLLNALAECAEGVRGTVCNVGRISRYIASLDAVDENLPDDAIKTADAYRAEILNKLGHAQANGELTRESTEKLLAEYAEKLPAHTMQKIRGECYAAFAED
jgi:hypothetical protein